MIDIENLLAQQRRIMRVIRVAAEELSTMTNHTDILNEDTDPLHEDYVEMQEFLSLQSDEVQENSKIVTPDAMGCEFALHVDKNTPAQFVPRMPRSAMPSENDTCARVTVAGTLIGCYIGYFRGEKDIQDGSIQKPNNTDPFLGGYHISRIDFTHALLPNAELVGDADSSEELWLVPYNAANARYVPKKIGKMFVSQLTFLPVSGQKPEINLTMYVWHEEPQGVWLNREVKLDPGCWKVDIHWPSIWKRNVHDAKNVKVQAVELAEFESQKKRVAAFLDRHLDKLGDRPLFTSW